MPSPPAPRPDTKNAGHFSRRALRYRLRAAAAAIRFYPPALARHLLTHTPRQGLRERCRCRDLVYLSPTPVASAVLMKATAAATGSGVCGATRLRGTYALARSGGGSGGEAPPDRCAYGCIEGGGRVHRRGQAAPSRAGPRLNASTRSKTRLLSTGQRRITACVMRSFTPSHGPRGRDPRLRVHTLPFQAHPRAGTEAFCSLGAARPRLRGR